MVPQEYTKELRKLQDRAEQLPLDKIKISFEKDNKCTLADKFKSFEPIAIGAASLAQVHKATLKSGETVAVKLQYPTLRVQMKIDLFVLR